MGWIAILAGIIGFGVGYLPAAKFVPTHEMGLYLSVGVLAGLDAIVGGARAVQEGTFKANVFLSGFIVTVIIAVGLSMFGDRINVPIWLATVFVFVSRVLQNVSYMRRFMLEHDTLHMPHLPGLHTQRKQSSSDPDATVSAPVDAAAHT